MAPAKALKHCAHVEGEREGMEGEMVRRKMSRTEGQREQEKEDDKTAVRKWTETK